MWLYVSSIESVHDITVFILHRIPPTLWSNSQIYIRQNLHTSKSLYVKMDFQLQKITHSNGTNFEDAPNFSFSKISHWYAPNWKLSVEWKSPIPMGQILKMLQICHFKNPPTDMKQKWNLHDLNYSDLVNLPFQWDKLPNSINYKNHPLLWLK